MSRRSKRKIREQEQQKEQQRMPEMIDPMYKPGQAGINPLVAAEIEQEGGPAADESAIPIDSEVPDELDEAYKLEEQEILKQESPFPPSLTPEQLRLEEQEIRIRELQKKIEAATPRPEGWQTEQIPSEPYPPVEPEHTTSGFALRDQPYQPAHPQPEPKPAVRADILEEERRRKEAERVHLDLAAQTILQRCDETSQELFRGAVHENNCSQIELLVSIIESTCADREWMRVAVKSMRYDGVAGNEKQCAFCHGEFRGQKTGQVYCCGSCGARANGMRPLTEHREDCCLVSRAFQH